MKLFGTAGLLVMTVMSSLQAASAATLIRFTYDQEAPVAATFSSTVRQGPNQPSGSDPGAIRGFGGTALGFLDVERDGTADTVVGWSFALSVPRGTAPGFSTTDTFTVQRTHEITLTAANSTAALIPSGPRAGGQRITGTFMGAVNNTDSPLYPLQVRLEFNRVAGLGPEGTAGYQLYRTRVECTADTACRNVFRDDVVLWNGTSGSPQTAAMLPAGGVTPVPLPATLPLLAGALLAVAGLRRRRRHRH